MYGLCGVQGLEWPGKMKMVVCCVMKEGDMIVMREDMRWQRGVGKERQGLLAGLAV